MFWFPLCASRGGQGDKIEVKLGGEGTEIDPFFYEIRIKNPSGSISDMGSQGAEGAENGIVDGSGSFVFQVECPDPANNAEFLNISKIMIYGLDGNDDIKIDQDITAQAWLFGGEGDDKLKGGSGDDVILGGAGDDQMKGEDGRDILIGGQGADKIEGDKLDDILIAGDSPIDSDLKALCDVLALWQATDGDGDGNVGDEGSEGDAERAEDAAARAATILGGGFFDGIVLSDGAQDELKGGSGADWFLADTSETGDEDKIGGFDEDEDFFGLDQAWWDLQEDPIVAP